VETERESLVVPTGYEAASGLGMTGIIGLTAELAYAANRGLDVIDAEVDDHVPVLVLVV
jgi:hypothetical protein